MLSSIANAALPESSVTITIQRQRLEKVKFSLEEEEEEKKKIVSNAGNNLTQ